MAWRASSVSAKSIGSDIKHASTHGVAYQRGGESEAYLSERRRGVTGIAIMAENIGEISNASATWQQRNDVIKHAVWCLKWRKCATRGAAHRKRRRQQRQRRCIQQSVTIEKIIIGVCYMVAYCIAAINGGKLKGGSGASACKW